MLRESRSNIDAYANTDANDSSAVLWWCSYGRSDTNTTVQDRK